MKTKTQFTAEIIRQHLSGADVGTQYGKNKFRRMIVRALREANRVWKEKKPAI